MKTPSVRQLLPFEAEDCLGTLGKRIATVRRVRGLTQADLAGKAGVGVKTVLNAEHGSPGVAVGHLLTILWALDLTAGFSQSLAQLGTDQGVTALLEEQLPLRVRGRGRL